MAALAVPLLSLCFMFLLWLVSLVQGVVLLGSLSLALLQRVDSHLFQMGRNLRKAADERFAII